MSVTSGLWAAHLAWQHGCCWIMEGVPCGLWCGHDGDHTPYVPGAYLREPLLHPLVLLRLSLTPWPWKSARCPVCGAPLDDCAPSMSGLMSWEFDGQATEAVATLWRFRPCWCEGREDVQR